MASVTTAQASQQQEQFWLALRMVDCPAMYNVPIALRIRGILDRRQRCCQGAAGDGSAP